MEKTGTVLGSKLARLTSFTARHRWPVIGVWVVLTLIGGAAAGKLSSRWYQSFSIPGKSAYEASQRTLNTLGVGVRPPNVVVFHTNGDATKSAAIRAAMLRAAGASRARSRARTSRRTTRCTSPRTGTRRSWRSIRRAGEVRHEERREGDARGGGRAGCRPGSR